MRKFVIDTFDKDKKWEGWLGEECTSLEQVETLVNNDIKQGHASPYYVVSDANTMLFRYEVVKGKKIKIDFK